MGAQVTLPPNLNNAINVAADLDACATAATHLLDCADEAGGLDALMTVAPQELFGCACCSSQIPLANAYSSCSNHLSEEYPLATTDYEAYGLIYTVCQTEDCGGGGINTNDEDGMTTVTAAVSETDIGVLTSFTSSDVLPTAASACWDMLDMFDVCIQETPGFADMPFASQAPCYCCRTRGDVVVWTDELDEYASECADWATTGEPSTIYPAASKFASFCDNFYDACEGPATETLTATETEPTGTEETGAPEPTDAGVQLRIGSAGFLVVA